MTDQLRHKIRTVVANGLHLYECRRCAQQWRPSDNPREQPDATSCPGLKR